MASFRITPPTDYLLHRDVCSYGYFVLAPNVWVPGQVAGDTGTFCRIFDLGGIAVRAEVTQPCLPAQPGKPCRPATPRAHRGMPLRITTARPISGLARAQLRAALTRMLRLDESAETIAHFHKLDPRWRRRGQGRLLRSPTLFEDIIKTVTSCNVAWSSTKRMNTRLCEVYGIGGAFPQPATLAAARPAHMRASCGVGYRDVRIVELAKRFAKDDVLKDTLEDATLSDAHLREVLIELPGIGPYAASNILQLLGRYGQLPLDTEAVRHGRTVLGLRGNSRTVMKRVGRHFAKFKDQQFRSYWFEMWTGYEALRGPAHKRGWGG